jgi:DNA polymerase-1
MILNNLKDLIPVIQDESQTVFAIDTETNGLDEHSNLLLLIQIATRNKTFVINYNKCDQRLLKYCMELLRERNVTLVGHNIKFDLKFLYKNLGVLFTNVFDTQLAEVISYAGSTYRYPSLAQLVRKYLRADLEKDTRYEFIDKTTFDFTDDQIRYAEIDVEVLFPIMDAQVAVVKDRGQKRTFDLEMQLLPVVAMMEHTGIKFDSSAWLLLSQQAGIDARDAHIELNALLENQFNVFSGEYKNALQALENIQYPVKTKLRKAEKEALANIILDDEIKAVVIPMINFGSSKQAKYILNKLGANIDTTNAKELKIHENDVPAIKHILTYREAVKKQTSFGTEFLRYVNSATGAIHTNFNQLGAVTGRFSSDAPNLQNIVSDPAYRKPFVARDGFLLATTDYSNIELRIIGEASKEPRFVEAFLNGVDLHRQTASLVFEVPYDSVTKDQRRIAKSLNFAVIYGTSANGLAYNFNMQLSKAKELLIKYFSIYPVLGLFLKAFGKKCIEKGFTVTLGGRRRYLSFVLNPSAQTHYKELGKVFRQAINTLPQGTSADMIKKALIYMFYENKFGFENFRPLLTVHDEIVIEFREEIKDAAVEFIGECMAKAGADFLKVIPVDYTTTVEKFWTKD